jgi:hypothetical protein
MSHQNNFSNKEHPLKALTEGTKFFEAKLSDQRFFNTLLKGGNR